MGQEGKGSVTKTLKWAPAPDGNAYFISANLSGSAGGRGSVSVALDKGEVYVLEKARAPGGEGGRRAARPGLAAAGSRYRQQAPPPAQLGGAAAPARAVPPHWRLPAPHPTAHAPVPLFPCAPGQIVGYAIPYMLGIDAAFNSA